MHFSYFYHLLQAHLCISLDDTNLFMMYILTFKLYQVLKFLRTRKIPLWKIPSHFKIKTMLQGHLFAALGIC